MGCEQSSTGSPPSSSVSRVRHSALDKTIDAAHLKHAPAEAKKYKKSPILALQASEGEVNAWGRDHPDGETKAMKIPRPTAKSLGIT